MALKRKRSFPSTISLSLSPSSTTSHGSTSTTSSKSSSDNPFFSGSTTSTVATTSDPVSSSVPSPFHAQSLDQAFHDTHLDLRTRKRWRDNRPSESSVHRHTLELLYSAARQPEQPSPQPDDTHMQVERVGQEPRPFAPPYRPTQRTSLHTYWSLPRSPLMWGPHAPARSRAVFDGLGAEGAGPGSRCEDCDAVLSSCDTYGSDSARDGDVRNCVACGRVVCDICTVCALGTEGRLCLGCVRKEESRC